ncbi:MAG: plasmid maintenance system killer protein [Deltaproteobacteria bacterium RIFOXYB12_FULL_58_9]|nr:MAG: plasmid maintenance system killer protein [Deltaproteobacteria bacterium RIFOXYB12_FULL_58_9]
MIMDFGNKLAEDSYDDKTTKTTRQFPQELLRNARRKILYLHDAASLSDLRVPPGNRLEALKGDRKRYYSIRINDQWRLVFRWQEGDVHDVSVIDCH